MATQSLTPQPDTFQPYSMYRINDRVRVGLQRGLVVGINGREIKFLAQGSFRSEWVSVNAVRPDPELPQRIEQKEIVMSEQLQPTISPRPEASPPHIFHDRERAIITAAIDSIPGNKRGLKAGDTGTIVYLDTKSGFYPDKWNPDNKPIDPKSDSLKILTEIGGNKTVKARRMVDVLALLETPAASPASATQPAVDGPNLSPHSESAPHFFVGQTYTNAAGEHRKIIDRTVGYLRVLPIDVHGVVALPLVIDITEMQAWLVSTTSTTPEADSAPQDDPGAAADPQLQIKPDGVILSQRAEINQLNGEIDRLKAELAGLRDPDADTSLSDDIVALKGALVLAAAEQEELTETNNRLMDEVGKLRAAGEENAGKHDKIQQLTEDNGKLKAELLDAQKQLRVITESRDVERKRADLLADKNQQQSELLKQAAPMPFPAELKPVLDYLAKWHADSQAAHSLSAEVTSNTDAPAAVGVNAGEVAEGQPQ